MLMVLKLDYRLDSSGFKSQLVREIFLFDTNMQAISGAHPASYSVGTGVISEGVMCPGCEVKHLPASSAQVKNRWKLFCLYAFIVWAGAAIPSAFTTMLETAKLRKWLCPYFRQYRINSLKTVIFKFAALIATDFYNNHACRFYDFLCRFFIICSLVIMKFISVVGLLICRIVFL